MFGIFIKFPSFHSQMWKITCYDCNNDLYIFSTTEEIGIFTFKNFMKISHLWQIFGNTTCLHIRMTVAPTVKKLLQFPQKKIFFKTSISLYFNAFNWYRIEIMGSTKHFSICLTDIWPTIHKFINEHRNFFGQSFC